MQINVEQLPQHLKRGLAPLYLISGDEPLLVDESVAAIRTAAANNGYERETLNVESGFDWNAFYASLQSGSLFSSRRLIELRLPTGRPGEAGGKILAELAEAPPADTVLVVRCGKLEKAVRASKWVKLMESAGISLTVYPLDAAQLPGWIARRMRAAGLAPGEGVAERLAWHAQGNLLAAAQEIEKLALTFGAATVSLDDIEGVLGDNARYSVYALADACLRGAAAETVRMLRALRGEGEAPALVCWALMREVRTLAQLSLELAGSGQLERVLDAHRDLVWAKRRPLFVQALKRSRSRYWLALLRQAGRVERVVKGRASGDPWQALECLALAMGGTRVPHFRYVAGEQS